LSVGYGKRTWAESGNLRGQKTGYGLAARLRAATNRFGKHEFHAEDVCLPTDYLQAGRRGAARALGLVKSTLFSFISRLRTLRGRPAEARSKKKLERCAAVKRTLLAVDRRLDRHALRDPIPGVG
jgi:hypothetical protein